LRLGSESKVARRTLSGNGKFEVDSTAAVKKEFERTR
jgi:hypothetical protein